MFIPSFTNKKWSISKSNVPNTFFFVNWGLDYRTTELVETYATLLRV